jgi:hypothetical protein
VTDHLGIEDAVQQDTTFMDEFEGIDLDNIDEETEEDEDLLDDF